MENKNLIDITVKYGLSDSEVSKLADIVYQVGVQDFDAPEFKRVANYICEMKLLKKPLEDLIEELKLKGLIHE